MMILGVDPGGTTGLCEYYYKSDELWAMQFGPEPHHGQLWKLLHKTKPNVIVCERFDYRRRIDNVDLSAVEYIGVIRLFESMSQTKVVMQPQLKGHKGLWTDDKLKTLGLYNVASPHKNDATRQVLYYTTSRLNDTRFIERLRK